MTNKITSLPTACHSRAQGVKQRLLEAAHNTPETLLVQYGLGGAGLDPAGVERNRAEYGKNALTQQKKTPLWQRFLTAFVNPFTLVLLALAAISFVTDFWLATAGEKDITAVSIVLCMVLVSGMLRFVQEYRSGKAAEKLTEMVETTVTVQRLVFCAEKGAAESLRLEIPLDELVVGDMVCLAAGDMIPADVRIVQAKDLFVAQASLTGESEPVEKVAHAAKDVQGNVLELPNTAFMGSNVISGSALAVVLAVGDDTLFGGIARHLQTHKTVTSFEKGVNAVSWVLIRFMLVMAPVVLFVNGFTKGDWVEALLFALSVAVGLTPEMLPMIVSVNLAKGAVRMSRKKVIVKHLNAIQNFGAMDILCTDKTGTITQDKIILEYHLDIHGKEDARVLRHAFLNSHFQTGLKNLLDISIIEHARELDMEALHANYRKVDEIPFDFQRRRMSVVVEDSRGKTQLITKGAIEEMLSISSFVEYGGTVAAITDSLKREILETCRQYNADGFRVLGVAHKTNPAPEGAFGVADESEMVLIGYLAFLDPPKQSAAEAIAALHEYGVTVKVLTGDNDAVTRCVCKQVGLAADSILLGTAVEGMSDRALQDAVETVHVFAKLSPGQKARIVSALRANGHTVGFMGDGINDAAAMKAADVGISVDTAVDIAKESASIILLEKDLMVLEQGAIEGRRIYANIIKYIKMTASSNFGNMFSVLVASAFLPFLPMLPIQILLLNLIYDISCITIPWDNVDPDYLKKPRAWDASSLTRFMLWIGPTSSVFDITTYVVMFLYVCPLALGGAYHTLAPDQQSLFAALFHAGWFVESLWSQTLVIHMIRTPKLPFVQSRASWQLTALTTAGIATGTCLPYTGFGASVGLLPLPGVYFGFLAATIVLYMLLATAVKTLFVRRYGALL